MRISVAPEQLRTGLSKCAKVSAKDSKTAQNAVHAYVALDCSKDSLRLTAQDAHVCLETQIPATVTQTGFVLVECSRLAAVLAVRPDGVPLQLWLEGSYLHLKQGEFKAKLPILRGHTSQDVSFSGPFDIDTSFSTDVLHALRRCSAYVEDDEGSMFAGLLVDFSEIGVLRLAAFTRALLQISHFDSSVGQDYRFVLSPRCLAVLSAVPQEGFRFAFSAAQSKAFIFTPTFSARIACVEDRYPKQYKTVLGLYRWRERSFPVPLLSSAGEVVSEHARQPLVFAKQDLQAALASAATALGRDDVTIEMKIGQRLASGKIVVEFVGKGATTKAHASEKVLADGDFDSAISLGLNFASIRDLLKCCEGDTVTLHIGRKEDAVAVTDSDFHAVALATLMRL